MKRLILCVLFILLLVLNSVVSADTGLPDLSTLLSLFSAHATAESGVRLNWSLDKQSPTIVKFRLYRGYEEVGSFAVLAEVDAHGTDSTTDYSYADLTARPGVSYYYKIAASGQSSESVFPVVISATLESKGQTKIGNELVPAAVLAGPKIELYVRRAGKIKLDSRGTAPASLVNDVLRPGIYEFDPPQDSVVSLHLSHEEGYETDIQWPIK